MATQRPNPYIWATWITGLLTGDDHCAWAAWFKAHFRDFQKVARENAGDLITWRARHSALVEERAARLRSDGWTVYVERQNEFWMRGKTGIELSGVPDIVAIHSISSDALVIDCKSGKPREKDWWQVALYMVILPLAYRDRFAGKRVYGEVSYSSHAVAVRPEQVQELQGVIIGRIQATGAAQEPPRAPSYRECSMCELAECPERLSTPTAAVETELF